MKTKLSLSLLALIFVNSLPALAETSTTSSTQIGSPVITLAMSAEEFQGIKDLCKTIADSAGLRDKVRTQYIEECIAIETMVSTEPDTSTGSTEITVEVTTE